MAKWKKTQIKEIKEIDVVSTIIKNNWTTLPLTHMAQLQGLQTMIISEVLDILFNESKERK